MSLDLARELLSAGARLLLTHTSDGDEWTVAGGGITADEARMLIRDLTLRPARDALIEGCRPQSWGVDE